MRCPRLPAGRPIPARLSLCAGDRWRDNLCHGLTIAYDLGDAVPGAERSPLFPIVGMAVVNPRLPQFDLVEDLRHDTPADPMLSSCGSRRSARTSCGDERNARADQLQFHSAGPQRDHVGRSRGFPRDDIEQPPIP